MSKWDDPPTCIKGSSDNDGLWTSMYLAIVRYFGILLEMILMLDKILGNILKVYIHLVK